MSPNSTTPIMNALRRRTRTRIGASGKASTGFRLWQPGAVLLGLLLVAPVARGADGVWPWPVPTDPPAITGTFMESRETRYHTGLDVRTAGRTGWPVLSPVDGEVRRIRASARGYGLALYVLSDGGETVVFAHLDRFFAPAAERLAAAQSASGRYEQDLPVGPGEIPVSRGQVVALSGETGIGAPHLHLEVRDAGQRPLNPADFLELPDQVAPEVVSVRLLPLDPGSPFTFELDPGASVPARGRWLVEVLAVDRTGLAPFPVAPRSVALYVDGTLRYRLSQDGLSFEEARQMRLDQTRDGRGRWYRMDRRAGSTLPGRAGAGGAIEVGDRPVELWVVVEDASGHRGEARVELLPSPVQRPVTTAALRVTEHLLVAEFPGPSEMPPLLEGPNGHELLREVEGGWRVAIAHEGLENGTWKLLHRAQLVEQLELRFGHGAFPGFAASGGPGLAPVPADAIFPGGALALARVEPGAVPGMRAVGPAVEVESFGLVPAAPLDWQVPAGHRNAVLMRSDGREWSAVPDARSDAFGRFAYCVDESAPVIGELEGPTVITRTAPREEHGIPLPPWPTLIVPVHDEGSGLPDSGPEVLLDGRPWPVRYDGERDRLLLDWFVAPGPGTRRLEVRARDLAGNETVRRWSLEFRP